MSDKPYAYQNREDVLAITWKDFHGICKGLAEAIYSFRPDIILAIGRGGFYPGTLLAHMLQVEIFPIRLSRRVKDIVQYKSPQWLIQPPASVVKDHRVLIVDEICDTGETLMMAKEKVKEMSPAAVKSAVLYSHTLKATVPDYIGLITDSLLLNPWDREIVVDGNFRFHPEYIEALTKQGIESDPVLLVEVPSFRIAKGYS